MLKLKSKLTCFNCSRIYKDPIELPCEDSICSEHLTEKDVVKQNRIKCMKCKQEFSVENNEFKSNKTIKQFIDEQVYLSDEEITLKQRLEKSIKIFFQVYEEFTLSKNKLDMDCHNHFQEMRFQIDEHREKLKERIDEIALEMIDKTKKYEAMYSKSLKENLLENTLTFKSIDQEMEEKFRNPILLLDSIKEMQLQQEKDINDITLKLNEISQVKVHLKATNEFKPNLTSLLHEISFGSILLSFGSIFKH
jgi:hypothetical protein